MNLSFGVVNRSSSSSRIELFLRWSNKNTWNTVRQDCKKVSKWLRESSDPASENLPPKICIPNNEKINMKRNRIISKEFIDEMEFTRDFTKLPIEDQYLQHMCLGHLPLLIYRSICLVVVNKFTYTRSAKSAFFSFFWRHSFFYLFEWQLFANDTQFLCKFWSLRRSSWVWRHDEPFEQCKNLIASQIIPNDFKRQKNALA